MAEVTPDTEALLRSAYAAFNTRDIDAALALAHPDVDWPNMIEGGRAHGHAEVRAYWEGQFAVTDPQVEPQAMSADGEGRIVVVVHQVVRDMQGTVVADQMVRHAYSVRDGRIARMDVLPE